jgi:hypothetical protein
MEGLTVQDFVDDMKFIENNEESLVYLEEISKTIEADTVKKGRRNC